MYPNVITPGMHDSRSRGATRRILTNMTSSTIRSRAPTARLMSQDARNHEKKEEGEILLILRQYVVPATKPNIAVIHGTMPTVTDYINQSMYFYRTKPQKHFDIT